MRTNLKVALVLLVGFLGLVALVLVSDFGSEEVPQNRLTEKKDTIIGPIPEARVEYGLFTDSLKRTEGVIKPNEFLSNILAPFGIGPGMVSNIAAKSKDIFSVRRIATGHKYLALQNDTGKLEYFVYEINAIDYLVYDLRDSIRVYIGEKPVIKKKKQFSGIITSSLYQTIEEKEGNTMLAHELANIFAWTIDFYRIQKYDWFKVIYEEEFVDGKSVGVGDIKAIHFNHWGNDFYAIRYVQDSIADYYDDSARSLRKAFLKAPLKYSRISSGFTLRRFHPVQNRWKAHLGTDYAAPTGTPIMSTGDGVVIEAAFKKYNGRYVKVKHNSVYTTQYLHMSKFATGIKPGVKVQQGDIIGYVGSTGLATGPHVCYRFWKNGQQVNHLAEKFPASEPVKEENYKDFMEHRTHWMKRLDGIETPKKPHEQ